MADDHRTINAFFAKKLGGIDQLAGKRQLARFNAAVGLLIVVVLIADASSSYFRIVRDAEDHVTNLATMAAEQTYKLFSIADVALRSISSIPASTAPPDIAKQLEDLHKAFPALLVVFLADADGKVIATSDGSPSDADDLTARMLFQAPRRSVAKNLFIEPPHKAVVGKAEGKWVLAVSRRLQNPDGSFAGIVAADIAIDYFANFYKSLLLGRDGIVGLATTDGGNLFRVSFDSETPNIDVVSRDLPQAVATAPGGGVIRTDDDRNGISRIVGFRPTTEYPLLVYTGVSADERLEYCWWRLGFVGLVGILVFVLIVALSARFSRTLRSQLRATSERARRQKTFSDLWMSVMGLDDPSAILRSISECACTIWPTRAAFAALFEWKGDETFLFASAPATSPQHLDRRLNTIDPNLVQTLLAGNMQPVFLSGERLTAQRSCMSNSDAHFDDYPPSILAAPIQSILAGESGFVAVTMKNDDEHSSDDADAISELARIAASCITRARIDIQRSRAMNEAKEQEARAREAEQSVEGIRQQLDGVLKSIPDAIVALDTHLRIVFFNDGVSAVCGASKAALLGKKLWAVFNDNEVAELSDAIRTALDDDIDIELRFNCAILGRWIQARVFPTANGPTVCLRDISSEVANEELVRQSQKMEAIGHLTGGIAHDFNNLLTVILGNTELLGEQLPRHEPTFVMAEMARTAAQRGADLTHRLLAFARRQALEPRATDVNSLLANLEPLLRRTITESVTLRVVSAPDLAIAQVDTVQLESAIINLCVNSRDAMQSDGTLTIETANAELDEDYAQRHVDVSPGPYVMVSVSDTGPGIPADIIDRVFEPFFTTKEVGKGTGLGLSMVYGFVKQSKGHVNIYSEIGHGTSVKIYLPKASNDFAAESTRDTQGDIDGGNESILIVEDDELVRSHVQEQVNRLGYRVLTAEDGSAAMEILQSDTMVDLLFTDVIMPGGMNGRQLSELAIRARPGLKVLFTSGYTENAIIHAGKLDPGVHLLSKPYRNIDLARAIRHALQQHSSMAS